MERTPFPVEGQRDGPAKAAAHGNLKIQGFAGNV